MCYRKIIRFLQHLDHCFGFTSPAKTESITKPVGQKPYYCSANVATCLFHYHYTLTFIKGQHVRISVEINNDGLTRPSIHFYI